MILGVDGPEDGRKPGKGCERAGNGGVRGGWGGEARPWGPTVGPQGLSLDARGGLHLTCTKSSFLSVRFESKVVEKLNGTVTPIFVGSWVTHMSNGEVHCGSNARRAMLDGIDWWQSWEEYNE